MDMDMYLKQRHVAWTCACSMDLDNKTFNKDMDIDIDIDIDLDIDTDSDIDFDMGMKLGHEIYARGILDDFSNISISERNSFFGSNGQFRIHLIQFCQKISISQNLMILPNQIFARVHEILGIFCKIFL